MNIFTLSPIILILAAIIVFLITKKILKAIGFLFILLILGTFLTGILFYQDVQEFKERFPNEEKLFLLNQDEVYLAGFVMKTSNEPIVFLDKSRIDTFNQQNKKEILGDNYKIFLFSKESFEDVIDIELQDLILTKDEVFTIIDSEDPTKTAEDFNFTKQMQKMFSIENDAELNALLFAGLFTSAQKEDPVFLFSSIKKGTAEVYPPKIIFRIIKILPEKLFEALNKGAQLKNRVMN